MTLWGKSDFIGGALGTNVSIETEPAFSVVTGTVQYVAAPEAPSGRGGQPAVNAAARMSVNPLPSGKTKYRVGFKTRMIGRAIIATYYPIFTLRNNTAILAEVGYRGVANGTSPSLRYLGLRMNAGASPNERPTAIANEELWSFEVHVDGTQLTVFAWSGASTNGFPTYTWSQTLASVPNNFGLGPAGSTGVRATISDYWATDGERYSLPPWTFPSDAGYEPFAEYDDGGSGMSVGTIFAVREPCRLTTIRWWCPGSSGAEAIPELWDATIDAAYVKLAEGIPENVGFGWTELPIGPIDLVPGVDYVVAVRQPYTQFYTAEPVTLPIEVGPVFVLPAVPSGIGRYAYAGDSNFPAPRSGSPNWFGVDAVIIGPDTAPAIPTGNATTATSWSTSAVGRTMRTGFASTAVNWSAAASGQTKREGVGTPATTNWAVQAAGRSHRHGVGSVGVLWAASAQGQSARQGSAATAVAWSAAAAGSTPALDQPQGQAATSILWSTLALGSTRREGHAATAVGWSVAAHGVSVRRGQGAVESKWVVAAEGISTRAGVAIAETLWSTQAAGQVEPLGAAVAVAVWSTEAVGKRGFVILRDITFTVTAAAGHPLVAGDPVGRAFPIAGPAGHSLIIGGPTT